MNFSHAVHSVARPGMSRMPASAIPRRARLAALHQRYGDQKIHRRVFEEIDAVGEKRDRADGAGNGELDAEKGQVQDGNDNDDPPQLHVHRSRLSVSGGKSL